MSIVLIDATSNSLTVSWPETPGAVKYKLQFCKAGTDEFETLSDQLTTTQARKRNLGDSERAGFLFRVSAVLPDGTSQTDGSSWKTHSEPFQLLSSQDEQRRMAAPVVTLAGKNETLRISWNKQESATTYELQMRENGPGMDWTTIAASISGTEANKKHLTSAKGYQFRVRPVSSDGSFVPFSSPSEPVVALGLSQGMQRLFQSLESGTLLRNGSQPIPLADALGGKEFVLLYASAHWCPPCRKFTPLLSQWYQQPSNAKSAEVVFLSADHDERGFKDYFRDMPWLAVDYEDDTREQLMAHIRVSGIPRLVVLDGRTGRILVDNAVGQSLDVNHWRSLASNK